MYTLRKFPANWKNSCPEYISEESSQRTLPSGSISRIHCPSSLPDDITSDTISILSSSPVESWVLQSKELIFSTSSPQNDIL